MHMPRWEQLRSFLTWKTKWWRACKCFLRLHEHKWGTSKKSLSSSLQNPFRSQLSQREHQFSVWRATAKPACKSLSQLTDCPLPFLSSQPRLRALSSARQVSVPTFCARLEVQTCRMFPCSTVKKETASSSHWETMSARGLGFRKQRHRNVSHFFPQSHTVPALSLFWELLELQYGNISLHSNGSMGLWNWGRALRA